MSVPVPNEDREKAIEVVARTSHPSDFWNETAEYPTANREDWEAGQLVARIDARPIVDALIELGWAPRPVPSGAAFPAMQAKGGAFYRPDAPVPSGDNAGLVVQLRELAELLGVAWSDVLDEAADRIEALEAAPRGAGRREIRNYGPDGKLVEIIRDGVTYHPAAPRGDMPTREAIALAIHGGGRFDVLFIGPVDYRNRLLAAADAVLALLNGGAK